MYQEIKKLEQHFRQGKTADAFAQASKLFELFGTEEERRDLIQLENQYKDWERRDYLGLEPDREEVNRIKDGLMVMVDSLGQRNPSTAFRPPPSLAENELEDFIQPTQTNPWKLGCLVDVSISMNHSLANPFGQKRSRLDSIVDSLEDLLKSIRDQAEKEENQRLLSLFRVLIWGFGFGNPISMLLEGKRPKVRSLLREREMLDFDPLAPLVEEWETHRAYVDSLSREMGGATPLLAALQHFQATFEKAAGLNQHCFLIILSDGEPTDGSPEEIQAIADQLKENKVTIITGFVTPEDVTAYKTLYGQADGNWPKGARMMYEIASPLPKNPFIYEYLSELRWDYGKESRLFAQVNESETLKELLKLVLSPLQK